jgi:hypothetical protein
VPLSGHCWVLNNNSRAYNYLVYVARQSVERLIRRLLYNGIFKGVWRFSFDFHRKCIIAACKLLNVYLIFELLG